MVECQYANAYKEVLEILKYVQIEDYNKIPKAKIELFETYYNKDYVFEYNPKKTLNEQNVSKTAKAIIGILFRDYWATETQKDKIISKQKHFISIHQILADKLHITPEYLQENNFDKIIFITN